MTIQGESKILFYFFISGVNQGLVLQVSYLIPFIWVCFESYFKGSAVIKYTYLACLKVVLWFLFAICGLFVFMVHWAEKYSDSCQTYKMELSAKLVHKWELLTFYSKKLDLRMVLNTPHLNKKVKCLPRFCYILQFEITCVFFNFSTIILTLKTLSIP